MESGKLRRHDRQIDRKLGNFFGTLLLATIHGNAHQPICVPLAHPSHEIVESVPTQGRVFATARIEIARRDTIDKLECDGSDLKAGRGCPADYARYEDAPGRCLIGKPSFKMHNESLSILASDGRWFAADIVFNEIEQLGLDSA
jgi:hypothetical protein